MRLTIWLLTLGWVTGGMSSLLSEMAGGSGQPCGASVFAADPLLKPEDRIALLGGTFVERMQMHGSLEAHLQRRRPDWRLRVRNLGWSGDDVHGIARKRFDGPADGFKRLLQDVETANPTVVLVAYGFSEASDGSAAVDRFEQGLAELVDQLLGQNRRVILLEPVAFPGYKVPGYPQYMERCGEMVRRLGQRTEVPVVSLKWQPSDEDLTEDRLLPSAAGYEKIAKMLAPQLVGGQPVDGVDPSLTEAIADKNQLFFHRYRPQNETYLFLFRKHEQGNNAVEIPQFDPLIQKADQAIWRMAAAK